MGKQMILFCEECGQKNVVDELDSENLPQKGFECNHCGFTPYHHSNQYLQSQKRTHPPGEVGQIAWGPENISFGTVAYDTEAKQRISFLTQNGNISCMIHKKLQNDLQAHRVDHQTVEICLLPLSDRAKQNTSFKGPAIYFADTKSDFSCTAHVTFNRGVSSFAGLSEVSDLGDISSQEMYNGFLFTENSGNKPLLLQLRPDPNDFSIAARFVIKDSLAVTLAPGEKKNIAYTLWPEKEISEDWTFRQKIEVTINESGLSAKKTVVIAGNIIAVSE